MHNLSVKAVSVPHRWHNPLPEWILDHEHFTRLPAIPRTVLQGIADAADAPDEQGSLLGAIGGAPLIRAIGCSRSRFWSSLEHLYVPGFIVLLGRGGVVRIRSRNGVANAANTWGVPGHHAALNHLRVDREVARIIADSDGRLRRHVTQPGQQATFWLTRPQKSDYPSPKNGLPQSDPRTLPSCFPSLLNKNHADGARTSKTGKKHGMGHIEPRDLQDFGRLMRLFKRCVDRGYVDATHAGVIWFVTAAEHAIRCATRSPAGLFASTIRQKEQRVLYVTTADEDAAMVRIRAHRPAALAAIGLEA